MSNTSNGTNHLKIQIPADAVETRGDDILEPVANLLIGLGIKGTRDQTNDAGKAKAVFGGSDQSVAVIEATATAACKWWSAGLGVTVAALWASIAGWWDGQNPANQRVVLWAAAIVTAAAVLGIAYLLGSDVRSRAAASVATIGARAQVGDTFLRASQAVFAPSPAAPSAELVALAPPLDVSYISRPSPDEAGWQAIALQSNGQDVTKYLIAKGAVHSWVDTSEVTLTIPPTPPG